MTYPTIRPEITLDFANSRQLDPRIKFSRSSSATYLNPDTGLITLASDHEARLEKEGLLMEESRTNLFEQSEDLNTWWIKHGGVTVTSNATPAPDISSQADKLVSPNISNRFSLYKQLTLTANKKYTCSCFAKADEWNFFTIAVGKTGSPYTRASYTIDLTTGDVNQGPWQNTPTFESFTKTKLSNGWWRLAVSVKVDLTSTDFQFEMGMSPTNQFNNGMAGDGSSGIYMWGAQLEEGSFPFPTSYIPTSGSTVTRSADICKIDGYNFSSWYNQSEGTITYKYTAIGGGQFLSPASIRASNGRDAQSWGYWMYTGGSQYRVPNAGQRRSPTENVSLDGVFTSTVMGQSYKAAVSHDNSTLSGVLQGYSTKSRSITPLPTMTELGIGYIKKNWNGYFTGHVTRLSYYNKRLTDAELQTLTQ